MNNKKISLHQKELIAEIMKVDVVYTKVLKSQVTSMVTKGEDWRCKFYISIIKDATSLALLSKRKNE